MYHQLSLWIDTGGTTRALNNHQSQNNFDYHPQWVVFLFTNFYRRSSELINIFFHTNLFCYLVFLNLILNIFYNCSFISCYCINIISSAQKCLFPYLYLKLTNILKIFRLLFPFSIAINSDALIFGIIVTSIYMILTSIRFDYFYSLSYTYSS